MEKFSCGKVRGEEGSWSGGVGKRVQDCQAAQCFGGILQLHRGMVHAETVNCLLEWQILAFFNFCLSFHLVVLLLFFLPLPILLSRFLPSLVHN